MKCFETGALLECRDTEGAYRPAVALGDSFCKDSWPTGVIVVKIFYLHVPYSLQSTLLDLNMPYTAGSGPGVSIRYSLSPSLPTPSTECHKAQMQGEGSGELWSDPVL